MPPFMNLDMPPFMDHLRTSYLEKSYLNRTRCMESVSNICQSWRSDSDKNLDNLHEHVNKFFEKTDSNASDKNLHDLSDRIQTFFGKTYIGLFGIFINLNGHECGYELNHIKITLEMNAWLFTPGSIRLYLEDGTLDEIVRQHSLHIREQPKSLALDPDDFKYCREDVIQILGFISHFDIGQKINVEFDCETDFSQIPYHVTDFFNIVESDDDRATQKWTYKGFTDPDKVWDEKKHGSIGENTLFSAFLLGLRRLESSIELENILMLDTLQLLENVTFNMIHLI